MASSMKRFDERSITRRLSELVDNLSIDEIRILSRLLENWEKKDQRKHPRTPCSIITEYMIEDRVYKDKIKNIGLGGAFIQSQNAIAVDLEIFQSFFFPNFEIPIQSKSKIVWTGPNGFGVKFNIIENEK
ncbi:MAG: PilZ domain-containing protein [Desulfobacterales bacterium]|jgi:hypothetical protein